MNQDPRVIEYIEQFSPEYREILFRLRAYIFEVVPDVEEAIKWSSPTFSFRNKPVCYLKFKESCDPGLPQWDHAE